MTEWGEGEGGWPLANQGSLRLLGIPAALFSHFFPFTPYVLSPCPKFFSGSPSLARYINIENPPAVTVTCPSSFAKAYLFIHTYINTVPAVPKWLLHYRKHASLHFCVLPRLFAFYLTNSYSFPMKHITSRKSSITHLSRLLSPHLQPHHPFCPVSLSHSAVTLCFPLSLPWEQMLFFSLWILGTSFSNCSY